MGRVFNSKSGQVHDMQKHCFETKLATLKLITRHKQLLGSLLLYVNIPYKIQVGPKATGVILTDVLHTP
jgi:hypothetical protein